jgi:hypothetical protein
MSSHFNYPKTDTIIYLLIYTYHIDSCFSTATQIDKKMNIRIDEQTNKAYLQFHADLPFAPHGVGHWRIINQVSIPSGDTISTLRIIRRIPVDALGEFHACSRPGQLVEAYLPDQ